MTAPGHSIVPVLPSHETRRPHFLAVGLMVDVAMGLLVWPCAHSVQRSAQAVHARRTPRKQKQQQQQQQALLRQVKPRRQKAPIVCL